MIAFSDSEGSVTRQRSFSQLNSEQQDFENVLRAVNTLFRDNSSPGINSFNSLFDTNTHSQCHWISAMDLNI